MEDDLCAATAMQDPAAGPLDRTENDTDGAFMPLRPARAGDVFVNQRAMEEARVDCDCYPCRVLREMQEDARKFGGTPPESVYGGCRRRP